MLSFAYSPWDEEVSWFAKWKNVIAGVFIFTLLMTSLATIFFNTQAHAQTINSRCQSVTVYGDRLTKGIDEQGEFLQKLGDLGVREVTINAQEGRRISDVTNEINRDRRENKLTPCIVVDVGTANMNDKNSAARKKEIEDLLNATNGVNNVFWVLPTVKQNKGNPAPIQNQIREALRERNNSYPVSVDRLSFNNDIYDSNGITMTPDGYKVRSDAILAGIEEALNPATQDPSSNNNSSPSQPQQSGTPENTASNPENNTAGGSAPAPSAPSGNTGNGSTGGGSASQPSQGASGGSVFGGSKTPVANASGSGAALQPDGSMPPHNPGMSVESEKSQNTSPAYYARAAQNISNATASQRYLVLSRWDSINIPVRSITFSGGALRDVANSTLGGMFLSFALLVSGFIGLVIDFTFGFSITNVMLKNMDALFGYGITGGGSDTRAPILVYFTSIITFTIIMASLSAFNTRSGANIQSRITGVFAAVLKAVLAALFVYYMGVQSAKNSAGMPDQNSFTAIIDTVKGNSASDSELDRDGNFKEDIDNGDLGSIQAGGQSITKPGSWHALSLGWIVSMVFYISQLLVAALLSIYTALIKLPLDAAMQAANPISSGNVMPACDRYIDSMHQTYVSTAVYDGNQAHGSVRLALDKFVYNYLYKPYSAMYGGMTIAANNSWCWAAEVDSNRPAGEWLMLARGAGLYNDVAGAGSLVMTGSKYNNGRHNIEQNQTVVALPTVEASDNRIVADNGEWIDPTKGLDQAQIYMGVFGRQEGLEQARYYFAACRFDPGQNGRLSNEWYGVQSIMKGYGDAEGLKDNETTHGVETGSANYLNDLDCNGSQIIPGNSSDEELGNYGFGSVGKGEVAAQRWGFTPPDTDLFGNLAATIVDGMSALNPFSSGKDNDDKDSSSESGSGSGARDEGVTTDKNGIRTTEDGPENISAKFTDNQSLGNKPAKTFWDSVNGYKSGSVFFVTMFIAILAIILLIDFLIILLPIMIIKLVAGLIFLLVPLSLMFAAVGFAFRGGRR